ncbi:MAG: hypothetical protein HYZ54_05140 [Ignavibacteriae bacterium]|nr:hypothetical protein [Ignavibacteriota bacterium]
MTQQEKDILEIHNSYIADQQRLYDIARDCNFSLWNSLLTFNAIIITVFTGFLATNPSANKVIIFAIVFLSIFSAILLIFNFKSTKNFYFDTARDYFDNIDKASNLSDVEYNNFASIRLKKNETNRKVVVWFENSSIIFSGIQMILIIFFICNK